MMLHHLEFVNEAKMIENAIVSVLKEGIFTSDLASSTEDSVGTNEFADAIIDAMIPVTEFIPHHTKFEVPSNPLPLSGFPDQYSSVSAIDIFLSSKKSLETIVAEILKLLDGSPFLLQYVWNRGTLVYPDLIETNDFVDQWQCQFSRQDGAPLQKSDTKNLLEIIEKSFEWMHIEKIFDRGT